MSEPVNPHLSYLPAYTVWCPSLGQVAEDGAIVHALDESDAAKRWAKHDDVSSAEYSIVGGESVTVHVLACDEDSPRLKVFRVSGNPEPTYFATEVAEEGEE